MQLLERFQRFNVKAELGATLNNVDDSGSYTDSVLWSIGGITIVAVGPHPLDGEGEYLNFCM